MYYMPRVKVKNFFIGQGEPLTLISGPCVIESEESALYAAEFLKDLCEALGINFIYKSSYDKANRSSIHSFRGPGIQEGLRILEKIKTTFDVPVLTDVHSPQEALLAGQICDVLQIPAFLCRQTDLISSAASTGAAINVKKGQFMAPWDMKNVILKIEEMGNTRIILTDRGTTFGYNNLVCDMRAIAILKKLGYPVCFDASHAVQIPGGNGTSSGGEREFIPTLAKAAIAAGSDCLFIESHPSPSEAKSDKDSVYPFAEMETLLKEVKRIFEAVQPTCTLK
jgi:2-dehydro-3-deoxyphosphooctonate aldolase (KDO 8-P synthase)